MLAHLDLDALAGVADGIRIALLVCAAMLALVVAAVAHFNFAPAKRISPNRLG